MIYHDGTCAVFQLPLVKAARTVLCGASRKFFTMTVRTLFRQASAIIALGSLMGCTTIKNAVEAIPVPKLPHGLTIS